MNAASRIGCRAIEWLAGIQCINGRYAAVWEAEDGWTLAVNDWRRGRRVSVDHLLVKVEHGDIPGWTKALADAGFQKADGDRWQSDFGDDEAIYLVEVDR